MMITYLSEIYKPKMPRFLFIRNYLIETIALFFIFIKINKSIYKLQ